MTAEKKKADCLLEEDLQLVADVADEGKILPLILPGDEGWGHKELGA